MTSEEIDKRIKELERRVIELERRHIEWPVPWDKGTMPPSTPNPNPFAPTEQPYRVICR